MTYLQEMKIVMSLTVINSILGHKMAKRAKIFYFLMIYYSVYFDYIELASFKPEQIEISLDHYQSSSLESNNTRRYYPHSNEFIKQEGTTSTVWYDSDSDSNSTEVIQSTTSSVLTTSTTTTTTTTSTTIDPNSDIEDQIISHSTPPNNQPETASPPTPTSNKGPNDETVNKSISSISHPNNYLTQGSIELNVLFFSIFVVYVSLVKLIYHNVVLIKHNMTEPGILMIFGILWELVIRQLTTSYDGFPRFNSRIFFYLFLPSTVLESGSLLSNKWLFLNLFPILIHSIFGTLLYASFLGFTIYYLSRQSILNLNPQIQQVSSISISTNITQKASLFHSIPLNYSNDNKNNLLESLKRESRVDWENEANYYTLYDKSYLTSGSSHELNNITLADCLIFGTILSSVDATTILSVFSSLQVNEKLYYLVLGESLMNNAVVLVIINLLLDFFEATRLTVVKIYIAIIQFFITIIGSIFVGLILASIALASVRLTKRFQISRSITSYQNQCQAMVETLLILKLAYLTYTLANLAGTSSIVSLATFGILQDQYIKHNLNLRSQLAYRQVILATRTMGFSLVYPLLGMFLVEVANTSQVFEILPSVDILKSENNLPQNTSNMLISANAAPKLNHFANNQANLYWNFKFLSVVILTTVVYRFILVILLTQFCNLFTSSQLKIKFKEQILVAFGSLKGPLAFAIVHKLIESEEYRDRTMKNKHLFIYTILFITFISTLLKGSCIRPLVIRMKLTLCHVPPSLNTHSTLVFDEINCKVSEHISSGLNSLLGHTKSPYDRFVELNETHIKPWLTRDGSNTNWLSVFYDTLVLDETLNANCFYRSLAGNTTLQTHWNLVGRDSYVQGRSNQTNPHDYRDSGDVKGEKNWKTGVLDTIDENGAPIRKRHVQMRPKNTHRILSRRGSSSTSLNEKVITLDESTIANRDVRGLLKEFVMLNLKLEDARKRKQSPSFSSKVRPSDSDKLHLKSNRQHIKMIDSTSSDDKAQGTSSFEFVQTTKHNLIARLEQKLSQLEPENGKPSSISPSEMRPQPVGGDALNGLLDNRRKTYHPKASQKGQPPIEGQSLELHQPQKKKNRDIRSKVHTRSKLRRARFHETSDSKGSKL